MRISPHCANVAFDMWSEYRDSRDRNKGVEDLLTGFSNDLSNGEG